MVAGERIERLEGLLMSRAHGISTLAVALLLASDALVGCSSDSSGPPGATATDEGGDRVSQGSAADGFVDGTAYPRSVDATVEDVTGDTAADAGGQRTDAPADGAADDVGSDAATDGASVDAGGGPSNGWDDAESEAAGSDARSDVEATPTDGASDALVDVGEDAGDGGISETRSIILSEQGSDCAACAATHCLVSGQTCEALGTEVAASGPSAGTLRSTLCFDTLSCLVDPTPNPPCYEQGTVPEVCYCDPTETSAQCATNGPGAGAQCGTVELAGLETTDPMTAFSRFNETTTTLGAQMANAIVYCLDGAICGQYCLF